MSEEQDAMARSVEGSVEGYAKAPLPVIRNGGEWPRPKYRFSLVACARWETPYILEWLTYHRSIGFEHVYLYCNDDDPTGLYEKVMPLAVGPNPFVTFVHYGYLGLQFQMYFHFLRNYSPETEWLSFLDIDEFLTLRGVDDVGRFLASFPDDVGAIYFNWCSFGCNGHKTRPAGSVLLNYTRREDGATPFTKMLVRMRSIPYDAVYWKQPHPINHDILRFDDSIRAVNVLGEPVTATYYDNFPDQAWAWLNEGERRKKIVQKAFIAHYNMKSHEDFEFRVRRSTEGAFESQGDVWGKMSERDRETFHMMTNAVEDLYLHDYWARLCRGGEERSVFPPLLWPCLSRGKQATQSSSLQHHSVEEDAGHLISGQFWGRVQAHTQLEAYPWWRIDFGDPVRVHEIRLFNRLDDCLERVSNFQIDSSLNGENWETRFVKKDGRIYGGADGTPYVWRSATGFPARYVRVTILARREFLAFDQIAFYGTEDAGLPG